MTRLKRSQHISSKSKSKSGLKSLTTLLLAVYLFQPALAAGGAKPVVIQKAQYVSTGNQLQQFSANITLPEEDRGKPLVFSFYNGPDGGRKFNWVRVFLSDESNRSAGRAGAPGQPTGRMIVSEASFPNGLNKVDLNLTGVIKPGATTTLIINGAGLKGAAVGWEMTTPPAGAMQVISVSPTTARGGGTLNISGTGFSSTATEDSVYFNQTKVSVAQATPTSLQVEVPSNLVPGKYSLQVAVNGSKSSAFPIIVKGTPELTRTDWLAGPCGTNITIFGKNFSETASENTVFFGKTRATVVSSTSETLTVTVPQFPELDGANAYITPTPLELTVSVGTTPAKGHLTFISAKVGWQ